ncbi:MAG: hypothetical protein JSW51_01100 [Gemmatimonadota bacterium]|nr:MAG: hypothetical protein JSW51_01100 [Gemmatimonadota bacterium]
MAEDSFTPVTYSPEERNKIRAQIDSGTKQLSCPRCEGKLEVEGPITVPTATRPYYRVSCKPCRRMAFLS